MAYKAGLLYSTTMSGSTGISLVSPKCSYHNMSGLLENRPKKSIQKPKHRFWQMCKPDLFQRFNF